MFVKIYKHRVVYEPILGGLRGAHCCKWQLLCEVYDKYPDDNTAVLLKANYISEAGDTLAQLCALLPLEEWDEVISCKPGNFWSCTLIVARSDIDNDSACGARA